MDQIIFIVWRESIEAMLVVGILYTWLKATPQGRKGLPWLWSGVACGVGLAILLALALLGLSNWLTAEGQEWFQGAMALVACVLVVQMVVWMRNHGRNLKQDLQTGAVAKVQAQSWWGLLVLVMLAVAREGSETVVFLYGSVLSSVNAISYYIIILSALAGFIAALLTFWILQLGGKFITWRRFFKFTEIVLLLLAGALLVSATDRFISIGVLPTLIDPIWDSEWLLSTFSGPGRILADFAGYRSYPALSQLIIFILYWLIIGYLLHWGRKK